jgi:hypothetical protein
LAQSVEFFFDRLCTRNTERALNAAEPICRRAGTSAARHAVPRTRVHADPRSRGSLQPAAPAGRWLGSRMAIGKAARPGTRRATSWPGPPATQGLPEAARTSSSTFWSWRRSWGASCCPGSPSITSTAFETTTGQKSWSYGLVLSRRAFARAMLSHGRDTSLNCTEGWTPPTMLRVSTEHSWRWRDSNPRPSVLHQGFSGRSLLCLFLSPGGLCRQAAERAQPLLDVPPSPAAGPDGGSP